MPNNTETPILYDADKVAEKGNKILKVVYIIAIVLFFTGAFTLFISFSPVDSNSGEKIEYIIENGDTAYSVVEELEKENLIKNAFFLKIYLKISGNNKVYAGRYLLSKDMSALDIINKITSGTDIDEEQIEVMFVTGKRIPYYVEKISENFDFTEEEINKVLNDQDFMKELINKYWFLTDEILNNELYYPLEGYLWPDTYKFNKDSSIKNIIITLLDETNNKLTIYQDDITLSGYSVHSLLTLASMVELEAVTAEDRAGVAGVFKNRLNTGMTLGSDVTTYYAAKKEMTDKIYSSDLNACNGYNTRGNCVKGLPIGPICSPSETAIVASLKPQESNNLYFVADKNHKVYFNETLSGHDETIRNLKNNNLWA